MSFVTVQKKVKVLLSLIYRRKEKEEDRRENTCFSNVTEGASGTLRALTGIKCVGPALRGQPELCRPVSFITKSLFSRTYFLTNIIFI